jgi:hypothetical protein
MSADEVGKLIDLIKTSLLNPVLASDPAIVEDAEQAATEIVGEITSRYMLIPLPTTDEDAAACVELDSLLPGLFQSTKGRPQ